MISVIIPVYNQANKLSRTLESLKNQTLLDFELILVNDGSNDQPDQVLADFSKTAKIKGDILYFSQENKGAPSARNFGFSKSKGDFIFFCDADALLKSTALEKLLDALKFNLKASFSYSAFKWGKKTFRPGQFSTERLKKEPYIHTMSLIRREDFLKFTWDESIKKFQDWDLYLSMAEANKYGVYVDEILFTVIPGGHISTWLPSFAYKYLTWLPLVKKYNKAKEIILKKHDLV
jgi:glycosyltransferase involved in cell wall biosynthesis